PNYNTYDTAPGNILTSQPVVGDPYINRTFSAPSHCDYTFGTSANSSITSGGNFTLTPGVYCGGLRLGTTSQGQGNKTKITLTGGQYYIVGGTLNIDASAQVGDDGTGVTFILTGNSSLCTGCN